MVCRFFKLEKCSADERRDIYEMVFEDGATERIEIVQIKILELKAKAVESGMAVGNHSHTPESGRDEMFVAIGPKDRDQGLFKFAEEPGNYTVLVAYDGVFIPCGTTHAFVPICEGAILIGISNRPHKAEYDIPIKIL